MHDTIDNQPLNKILLKPRFKFEREEDKAVIIDKFKNEFAQGGSKFLGRVVDHHIVIDIPKEEAHFWSPQLHFEVEDSTSDGSILKGIFGPKPSVWSLFMFVHFAVAVLFISFLVITYTKWNLNKDYGLYLIIVLVMPVLWFLLYFMGRMGRRKGKQQMQELRDYLEEILEK